MNNYQDMNAMKTKLILTAALLIAVFSGCKKEKYLAASFGVSNTTETVYTTAAGLEATFSYPGTKYVIRVDVSERQDMSEAVHYDVKVNGDKLTAYVTGLKANTTYYYRYSNDTGFGILSNEQKSFKTNHYSVPAVTTAEVSEITGSSAKCGGNVICDGGFAVTARGVCWSTSPNPTVSDSHTTDGSGMGSFTSSITGLTENTPYYVRAYATNSKGTSYGEQKSFTNNFVNGHAYVDFGLPSGLLWATCNLGADKPAGYGWYFMWGSVAEGGDSNCSWANCPGNGGNSSYNADAFSTWKVDNLTDDVLKPEVDAARVNWGGGWRMPTSAEWRELYNNTNSEWAGKYHSTGVAGRIFTSKTDSSKSIFLPAAGDRYGTVVNDAGSDGYYWSSSLNSSNPNYAYYMYFRSNLVSPHGNGNNRCLGFSVRPVCAGQSISAPAVTTSSVSNITQTTATCGGNVICDGGFAVTARGVCWSTSPNPTVSDSHTTDGSGTGSFTSNITGLTANTTYYVRAYATNSAGTSYGEQKSFTTQSGGGGGHEYVDLGLPSGLKWATCNVGADSPEDYGDYFAWGETTTKSTYDWSTYKWCNGSALTLTKYCTDSNYGTVDNKTVLDPEDDAAHANWGGGWRMPTKEEWQELYDNTTCTWTTENGVYGRKFTSKTDGSKYIFLPAAGYRDGTDVDVAGSYGYYWSSSLYSSPPYNACSMYFYSGNVYPQSYDYRYYGFSVRPVQ